MTKLARPILEYSTPPRKLCRSMRCWMIDGLVLIGAAVALMVGIGMWVASVEPLTQERVTLNGFMRFVALAMGGSAALWLVHYLNRWHVKILRAQTISGKHVR